MLITFTPATTLLWLFWRPKGTATGANMHVFVLFFPWCFLEFKLLSKTWFQKKYRDFRRKTLLSISKLAQSFSCLSCTHGYKPQTFLHPSNPQTLRIPTLSWTWPWSIFSAWHSFPLLPILTYLVWGGTRKSQWKLAFRSLAAVVVLGSVMASNSSYLSGIRLLF